MPLPIDWRSTERALKERMPYNRLAHASVCVSDLKRFPPWKAAVVPDEATLPPWSEWQADPRAS